MNLRLKFQNLKFAQGVIPLKVTTQQKNLNLSPVESKSGYGTVNGRVYMSNGHVILSKCPTILSIKRVIMSNDPVVL